MNKFCVTLCSLTSFLDSFGVLKIVCCLCSLFATLHQVNQTDLPEKVTIFQSLAPWRKNLCSQFKLQKSITPPQHQLQPWCPKTEWSVLTKNFSEPGFDRPRQTDIQRPACQSEVLLHSIRKFYLWPKVHHPNCQVVCGVPKVPLKVLAFSSAAARSLVWRFKSKSSQKANQWCSPVSSKDWFSTALACLRVCKIVHLFLLRYA